MVPLLLRFYRRLREFLFSYYAFVIHQLGPYFCVIRIAFLFRFYPRYCVLRARLVPPIVHGISLVYPYYLLCACILYVVFAWFYLREQWHTPLEVTYRYGQVNFYYQSCSNLAYNRLPALYTPDLLFFEVLEYQDWEFNEGERLVNQRRLKYWPLFVDNPEFTNWIDEYLAKYDRHEWTRIFREKKKELIVWAKEHKVMQGWMGRGHFIDMFTFLKASDLALSTFLWMVSWVIWMFGL